MAKNEDQKVVIYWSTKKTISLICAILLVPMFVIFIFSATLKTTILNTNYYLDNLKKVDAYNRLVDDGIPSLILDTKISDNALTDSFAKELAIFIIQKSVDPIWVEAQTGKLVDKISEFLRNPDANISLDLSGTEKILNKVSTGLLVVDSLTPNCAEAQNASQNQTAPVQISDLKTNCGLKNDIAIIKNQVDKIHLGTVNLNNHIKNANSFIESVRSFTNNINFYFFTAV